MIHIEIAKADRIEELKLEVPIGAGDRSGILSVF